MRCKNPGVHEALSGTILDEVQMLMLNECCVVFARPYTWPLDVAAEVGIGLQAWHYCITLVCGVPCGQA